MRSLRLIKNQLNALFNRSSKDSSSISTTAASILLEDLSSAYQEYIKAVSDLESPDSEKNDIDSEINEIEEKYFSAREKLIPIAKSDSDKSSTSSTTSESQLKKFLEEQKSLVAALTTQISNGSSTSSASSSQRVITEESMKLPVLQIPKFNGNLKDWVTFYDLFRTTVHENGNLSSVQQFQYLKSLLQGEAASLISGISTTAENYKIALKKLEDRYNRPYLIVHAIIQRFFELESVSTNLSNLREFRNLSNETIQLLDARGDYAQSRDPWLIYFLVEKLDKVSKRLWAEKISTKNEPSLNFFLEFLNDRCAALDLYGTENAHSKISTVISKKKTGIQINSTTLVNKCFYCNKPHSIYKCQDFGDLSLSEKEKIIERNFRCYNCFSKGHSAKSCNSKYRCSTCGLKHNTLLHDQNISKNQENQISAPTDVKKICSTQQNKSSSILPTIKVNVMTSSGECIELRALLDSGSQANLISENAFARLGLKRNQTRIPFAWLGEQVQSYSKGKTNLQIYSKIENEFTLNITAHIMPKLINNLPSENVLINKIDLIRQTFNLADPEFFLASGIHLILGASVFFECLKPDRYVCSKDNLHVQNTHFGHIVCNKDSTESNHVIRSLCTISENIEKPDNPDNLENLVQQFWSLEEPPNPSTALTVSEDKCESIYNTSTFRLPSGRFSVMLPFKEVKPDIGHSYRHALHRFLSLERQFESNSEMKTEYLKFMSEYESLGHMTKTTLTAQDLKYGNYFVIPHHGVWQSEKKLRVVFDGSAKTSTGVSLNETLYTGPILQKNILDVLNNFRLFKFVATADIEKMYRQILVHPSNQDFQLICWRSSPSLPISIYRLKTVTYGLNCSPFLALRTIQELVNQDGKSYPRASSFLLKGTYVDDIFFGANDLKELILIRNEIIDLLAKGQFTLKKWASNHTDLLTGISENDLASPSLLTFENHFMTKALGIMWSPTQDIFRFQFCQSNIQVFSKRNLLSDLARLFDPFGWISPTVLQLKLLFQNTWALKIDWDTPLPPEVQCQWLNIRSDLLNLSKIAIPRFLGLGEIELHGFADASRLAYGAVIYARIKLSPKTYSTRLIISKTKLAPTKPLSIPRLELCAAHLLTKLVASCNSIPHKSVTLWSDSTTVLAWIKSLPKKWNVFVQNRISQINELCPNAKWRYIRSRGNPADIASRGISLSKLIDSELWWSGPEFLQSHDQTLGEELFSTTEELPAKRVCLTTISDNFWINIINNFSNFNRLVHCVAYVLRVKNLLKRCDPSFSIDLVSTEIKAAIYILIKNIQAAYFPSGLDNLSKRSPIYSLSPFLDEDGLIRVGGRLKQRTDQHFNPHPILLPKCHFSDLLIRKTHLDNYHSGFSLTCAQLRRKFWIIGMTKSVKSVLKCCVPCNRFNANTYSPSMADLPTYRITESKPFFTTGLDFAGPFTLRAYKHRGNLSTKGYIAVFICAVTKAFHLELIMSLSTSSLIMGINRFLNRRGKCETILSDNGRNFIACNSVLKNFRSEITRIVKDQDLKTFLSNQFIEWKFIPPYSPQFGGLWESGVKNVKRHLIRAFPHSTFTIEEFSTTLCQIEAILNSRPLIPLSFSAPDTFISPSHLLIQGEPSQFPNAFSVSSLEKSDIEINKLHKSRQILINNIASGFWVKWRNEYLYTMMRKPKWVKDGKSPSIGDIVAVKRSFEPPALWILGKIIKLLPSKTNGTRVVQVKTKSGLRIESVRNLVPLLVNETINGGSMED